MTLKWRVSTWDQILSARLFRLQSQRITPLPHNTLKEFCVADLHAATRKGTENEKRIKFTWFIFTKGQNMLGNISSQCIITNTFISHCYLFWHPGLCLWILSGSKYTSVKQHRHHKWRRKFISNWSLVGLSDGEKENSWVPTVRVNEILLGEYRQESEKRNASTKGVMDCKALLHTCTMTLQ